MNKKKYDLTELEKKLQNSLEARQVINFAFKVKNSNKVNDWRGAIALPPATPLEEVLNCFVRHTDIPLELPFFALFSFVSAYLCRKNIKFKGPLGTKNLDIWTTVLAPSGAGKTWTYEILGKYVPGEAKRNIDSPASSAAFLEQLSQNNPGFWVEDEFSQALTQIETSKSLLGELKGYLLKIHQNSSIQRNRKKDPISIEEPILTFLGLNTFEVFIKALSIDSLLDGFSQRFAFVVAEKDPKRHITQFPIYDQRVIEPIIEEQLSRLFSTELPEQYVITDEAMEVYTTYFKELHTDDMNDSFYRRIMTVALKYSVIYHFILGKENSEIDEVDMSWAMRLITMHINDLFKIIEAKCESRQTFNLLDKTKKYIIDKKSKGIEVKPRDLQRSFNAVKTTDQAKVLIDTAMLDIKTTADEVDKAFGW